MRTTITLDDDTARLLQEQVRRRGVTFKQAVNDALREALAPSVPRPPFVTKSRAMGVPAVPLDRALSLAADMEDEELMRKAALRE